jgi:hypothetical protein
LLKKVWARVTVEENNLNQSITALRRSRGRLEESIAASNRARELDPFSPLCLKNPLILTWLQPGGRLATIEKPFSTVFSVNSLGKPLKRFLNNSVELHLAKAR